MKKKRFIATVLSLCLAMSMTACKQNDSSSVSEIADTTESSTTIEIIFESDAPVETEPTVETEVEETTPETATGTSNIEFSYEEFDEPITMYGALTPHGYYNNEFTRVGMITPNDEYVIIGEGTGFYYFTLDGVVYRAAKTSFSSEMVEIPPETEVPPETDPTTPPTEGTTPPPTSGTNPPPAGTTPPPSESEPPSFRSETPTYFYSGSHTISSMNIDGYGTAYYYTLGTSGQLDQVNQLRAEAGVSALSGGDQNIANMRAVEASIQYSLGRDPHYRPNGQICNSLGLSGENAARDTNDPVSQYNGSAGHRENMISSGYTRMSTASAIVFVWVPDYNANGGYWDSIGSANVQCFW